MQSVFVSTNPWPPILNQLQGGTVQSYQALSWWLEAQRAKQCMPGFPASLDLSGYFRSSLGIDALSVTLRVP